MLKLANRCCLSGVGSLFDFRGKAHAARLRSFGEFEAEYFTQNSPTQNRFSILTDLFLDFHPLTRPILWRMLIAQAHMYRALLETGSGGPVRAIPASERTDLDGRQTLLKHRMRKCFKSHSLLLRNICACCWVENCGLIDETPIATDAFLHHFRSYLK